MNILHLEYEQYPTEAIQVLTELYQVESFQCSDQEELYKKLAAKKYDVIFTRLGLMIDQKAIDLQPQLKYVVTSTTGLNHIDTKAAAAKNIQVISLKGEAEFLAHIKSTAEHTWGLLLALIRHLPAAVQSVSEGNWNRSIFLSDELDEKKIGIIGYGRLGKIVAQYAKAFGMEVLVHDHTPEHYNGHTHIVPCTLEELLETSDVVVLLISWSEANTDFMDAEKFGQMKEGAYFINTARGELVNEEALLHALQSKKVKGAAVDVLWDDSSWAAHAQGSSALRNYQREHTNLLITPHMGGYGKDSIAKTRKFVTNKFISLAKF
jgi:D-3-phosphoglycerate dehydrogenase / 2-oxoglutarate reductase